MYQAICAAIKSGESWEAGENMGGEEHFIGAAVVLGTNCLSIYHSYSPLALWKTYSLPLTVKTPSFITHFL